MAPTKRKRTSTRAKPNKRAKYVDSSSATGAAPESPTYWEADCILDALTVGGIKTYHIQWKGVDPKTGRTWKPTWEPEANANALLVAAWEQEKARVKASIQHLVDGRSQSPRPTPRQIRNLRVIASSTEPSTRSSSLSSPSSPTCDSAAPVDQSSRATTPLGAPAPNARALSRVQIPRRGDSLDREKYVRFSQLNSSQNGPAPHHTQDSDLDSLQLFAARPVAYSSGIVHDSKSSPGEGSFIPVTQQTEETNQQSTNTNTNTNASQEEEYVTEDSGLLDIIQEAASGAISPARSIPETIPDTTVADSQSQRQRAEIGTLELVQSSSQPAHEEEHIKHGDEQHAVTQEELRRENHELAPQQVTHASQPTDSASEDIVPPERQQEDEYDTPEQVSAEVGATISQSFLDIETIRIVPNNPATKHTSQTAQNKSDNSHSQDNTGGAGEASQSLASPQVGVRESQASATEHSVPEDEEVAQFPFHSQHPIQQLHSPDQAPKQASRPDSGITNSQQHADPSAVPVTQVLAEASAVSATFPEHPQRQSAQGLPLRTSEHDDDLLSQFSEPEFARDTSPVGGQLTGSPHTAVAHASRSLAVGIVQHLDLAHHSQPPRSTGHSTEGREQNAQLVPLETDFSTQEETTESIRPTVEKEYEAHRASSELRHDSSQETPERPLGSLDHSSSPIPHPPSFSLGTQESKSPPRPCTPAPTSSSSIMAAEGTAKKVERELKELMAKAHAANPFTPKRRLNRPSMTPSVAAAAEASNATPTPASRLLSASEAEGTRSPSAIPDRLPAAQAPTSLRTVAFAPSSAPEAPSPEDTAMASISGPQPEPTDVEETVTAEPAAPTEAPESAASEEMEVSDADDEDTESLLNDDLQLAEHEFIVPLFIQGRQSDMYTQYIMLKKDLLEQFLRDPHNVNPIAQVEEILHYLWAVETHIDLVFAEAEMEVLDGETSVTQINHAAQFGIENSTKFRFLHTLFHHLRDSEKPKHIVLLTEKDDLALYSILEIFCKAKYVNYSMPTKSRQADPNDVEGTLLVTIIPGDASPIIRPPDLIVCLDGVQEATQIRKKNWARSPERDVVPVIHLVIPRTVGHIARYISPNLDHTERMHTIIASLAQIRPDIGKPIDEDTPRDTACAAQVADWLMELAEDEDWAWPLPSIGSVKDVIEYQTQQSQTSTTPPPPERNKRPLNDDSLDSAKRMRFTPQPQTVTSSSVTEEAEITRISDSMPGTAAEEKTLHQRLADVEEAYRKECEARKAEEQRFREYQEMCDKQQTDFENQTLDYRLLLGKQQTTENKLETVTNNNLALIERLTARTSQMNELNRQLNEQRATDSLSPHAQIVEITKLRSELADAKESEARALRAVKTAEANEEYLKASRIDAQDTAAGAVTRLKELETRMPKLELAASGEATKRKAMHLDNVYGQQAKQIKSLKADLNIVKRTLQSKEEEILRLKSAGRMGVGTRGTSTTPQPKVRSRAGSPLLGGRVGSLMRRG